jgi:hypothetical protein
MKLCERRDQAGALMTVSFKKCQTNGGQDLLAMLGSASVVVGDLKPSVSIRKSLKALVEAAELWSFVCFRLAVRGDVEPRVASARRRAVKTCCANEARLRAAGTP